VEGEIKILVNIYFGQKKIFVYEDQVPFNIYLEKVGTMTEMIFENPKTTDGWIGVRIARR